MWFQAVRLPKSRLNGSTPDEQRTQETPRSMTANGVTSGIDFGLSIAAELAGKVVAQTMQLGIEYNPAPPFDARSIPASRAELARSMPSGAAQLL
jgi:hypothetical protein